MMHAKVFAVRLGFALTCLLAADSATIGVGQDHVARLTHEVGWREVKWPFALDQWGTGRAFECAAADCGAAMRLYLRPKLGFCNCTTGVADDAELDRVGDLELLSDQFEGLHEGRSISVGWMKGRSRPYHVKLAYAAPATALAIAFNDKCDVVVATVLTERRLIAAAERAALEFLNGDLVLRWVERELGI